MNDNKDVKNYIVQEKDEYDIIEIQGNGFIRLHIPKREATEEEINEIHKKAAEIIVGIYKNNYNKEENEQKND